MFPRNEEVEYALFSMPTNKAPGSNGITMEILQFHWEVIKKDIFDVIIFFFKQWYALKALNYTYITLIPGQVGSISLEDCQPIFLVRVIYKCIAKVRAIRLSVILPSLISPNQTVFKDNIVLCHEFHADFNNINGSHRACLSIDFSKAFDKLQWDSIVAAWTLWDSMQSFRS